MDQQQQYCLKWSNYSSNLAMAFSNLFESETLTDVTLFCGGECHELYWANNFLNHTYTNNNNKLDMFVIMLVTLGLLK
jgi:hypothetical protein